MNCQSVIAFMASLVLATPLLANPSPAQAQGMPTCRNDVPQVLQLSTCLPDRHAEPNAAAAASAAAASAANAARVPKKTLTDVLQAREATEPKPRFYKEWLPDGAGVLKSRMGAR